MEKKQTAVEFIEDKWGNAVHWNWDEIKQWFETAKQMEKEQMEVCNNIVNYKFDIGFTLEDIKYAFESGQKNPNLKFEDILDNGSEKN